MGWYVFAWFVGLATGAGGLGFLWWKYNTRLQTWAANIGVKLPK
jgi:hypothetical protein